MLDLLELFPPALQWVGIYVEIISHFYFPDCVPAPTDFNRGTNRIEKYIQSDHHMHRNTSQFEQADVESSMFPPSTGRAAPCLKLNLIKHLHTI